ncbi:MAG: hypothetical protein U0411_12155 [Thermodesulfovibrionales bacterium]
MKTAEKRGVYIGTGMGLILFCTAGLLPGSFIGGVIGLKAAGALFGFPVATTVLSRILVGASMVLGIAVAGMVCTVSLAVGGWAAGKALDMMHHRNTVMRREAAERV